MISDEAVNAAVAAHCEGTMLAALEAAAPIMFRDMGDAFELLTEEWIELEVHADPPRPTMYVEMLQHVVDRFIK